MCLIIDANVAADFVNDRNRPAHAIVYEWVDARGGKLAVGGRLLGELNAIEAVRKYLAQRILAGRVLHFLDADVNNEETAIESLCSSNDTHVIALARVSGARRLFSFDNDLCDDFKDRALVSRPRGRVYRNRRHRRLLDSAPPCRTR